MIEPIRPLLPVIALIVLASCSGSDSDSPQSATNQPPSTSQGPTKPPPTTQPPTSAPPTTPPGSTPPGSGSGAFNQGTGFNSIVRSIVMAQDGTNDVYVGGDFTTYNKQPANHLIRLRPDGSVTQSFGQGFDQLVIGLARATDGSNAVYAAGGFSQFDGQPAPGIVRLTANGLRDPAFQPAPLGFSIWAIAVPDDGSRDVYVAGNISASVPGVPRAATNGVIVRLKPDGTRDPLFSTVTFPGVPDDTSPRITNLFVPPGSGKLYVGGSLLTYNGQPVSSLVRLNPDGTLDTTFVTGTGVPGSPSTVIVETIAPAADGTPDVYAGGRIGTYNDAPVPFGSIRVHENGTLDTTYRPAVEFITFAFGPLQNGTGDVLLSGYTNTMYPLVRLNRNGEVVSSFQQPTLTEFALSIVPVLDGTNDVYVGGLFTTYNGAPVNHIARVHADGSLASVVD